MSSNESEKNKAGWFTDYLSEKEVSFSLEAAKKLQACPWAKTLLKEQKITRAIKKLEQHKHGKEFNQDERGEIKSTLFEIRFAYNIFTLGLTAEYEHRNGVGKSSTDFKVIKDGNTWLIELTSCRESNEVKNNTIVTDDWACYNSISSPSKNSSEITDIIKIQQAILNKVVNKNDNPTKFPEVQENFFHVILVDMRSFNAGHSDRYDYFNIAYGSETLSSICDNNANCREWIDQNGKQNPIKGLFDDAHPDPRSRYLHERVHILGFISEEKYIENELLKPDTIYLFYNHRFFHNKSLHECEILNRKFPSLKSYT